MPDISRLHVHADGDIIEASEFNAEFDQIIGAVNDRVEADSTLWDDLYAERLHDGTSSYAVGPAGGTNKVPVCNSGIIQVGLNADLLDGSHLSDILDAGFDANTKMLFYQSLAPGGWTIVSAPSVHRHFGWKTGKSGGTTEQNSAWGQSLVSSGVGVTITPTTLTIAQIPSHAHSLANESGVGPAEVPDVGFNSGIATGYLRSGLGASPDSESVGGGGSHTHTAALSLPGAEWTPPVAWVIVCNKN